MFRFLNVLLAIAYVIIFSNCSESAELEKKATFREDFSSERLSVFRWGASPFSVRCYK